MVLPIPSVKIRHKIFMSKMDENNEMYFRQLINRNMKTEQQLLTRYHQADAQLCPNMDSRATLDSVDADLVKKNLKRQQLNVGLLEAAQCLTLAIFDPHIHSDVQDYIKKYVGATKVIGQGAYGKAASGSLKNVPDFFILKTAREPRGVNDLRHEAVVGLFALNGLRSIIPNFAFVYGFFEYPERETTLVYENVSGGQTWNRYAETCTPSQFARAYLQMLLAVQVAYERYNFTHYDANSGNIIVHKVSEDGLVVGYPYDNTTVYLQTYGDVCTFIDYGMAHVGFTYDDQKYDLGQVAGPGLVKHGTYPDRSNPLYDAFKILGFGLNAAYMKNRKVFAKIGPLLAYFRADPRKMFPRGNDEYYAYTGPPGDLVKLITYVRKFITKLDGVDPLSSTLECGDGCMNYEDVIKTRK